MKINNKLFKSSIVALALLMTPVTGYQNIYAQTEPIFSTKSEAEVSFKQGPLNIELTNSNISYKDLAITPEAKSYPLTGKTERFLLTLTDHRGYSANSRWEIRASLSPFESEGQESLNGAVLKISGGEQTQKGNFTTITPGEPYLNESVDLTSGGDEQVIAFAQRKTGEETIGIGEWEIKYPNVELQIQEYSATPGTHNAQITWALYNTP